MSDLKAYLDYKKESERLNREISEVERLIAVKRKELDKLLEEKGDLVYQGREIAEVLRKIEAEAS